MADVEILLATYKPDMMFFQKLLKSINAQTYSDILLSVVDDSDDKMVFTEISDKVKAEIKTVPFKIAKNEKNQGSTKTFERLTWEAQGEYLAFCDQDDIWEERKIEKLVAKIESDQAALCYSELSIIDETDKLTAKSFRSINKRIRHLDGDGLFGSFLRSNSVTGCTMLIRSDIAKQALPFCGEYYVHDHWLALVVASAGRIAYVHEPLVQYRIHGGNQIGNKKLADIYDKQSYLSQKLLKESERYEYLLSCGRFSETQLEKIRQTLAWVNVRMRLFEKRSLKNTCTMLGALPKDPQLILFELILAFAPASLGHRIIKALKKN